MTFPWDEYHILAKELNSDNTLSASAEAKNRSAISRLYYGVFCSARNYVRDEAGLESEMPNNAKVHEYTKKYFSHRPERFCLHISTNLDRLRDFRNKADYDDQFPGLEESTEAAIGFAEAVQKNLALLNTFPPP